MKMASFDTDNLTDSELRSKLAEYGHPVGPVTETTRKILIKKLKILIKQKNASRNANRSLTRFSSGDESGSDTDQNGGNRNLRRISMPPPTSYKSTKRKSASRNISPEISPVPSISKVSCSTPLSPIRSNPDFKVSRYSSPTFSIKQSQSTAIIRPIISSSQSYDFESGSDSDLPDFKYLPSSTNKKRTGLPYGSLSSYRSRLNSANARNLFTAPADSLTNRLRNDSKKDSRPFLSGFVNRFSRKSSLGEALNPLNIKESDAEEDRFVDKWKNVNIASRSFNFRDWSKPFKSAFQHLQSKDNTISTCYKSYNSSQLLSMVLLGLFVLFFIWLALAYFRVSHRAEIGGKSSHQYPLCTKNYEGLSEMPCIPKENLSYAIHLYKDIHLELQARGLRSLCGPALDDGSMEKPYMGEEEVKRFLRLSRKSSEAMKVEKGIEYLKLLILANRHWEISLLKQTDGIDNLINAYIDKMVFPNEIQSFSTAKSDVLFIGRNLKIPWTCYLARLFYKVIFTVVMTALGLALAYACYTIWNYYRKIKQDEDKQVMAMVERILEHVSEVAERANSGIDSNGSITSLPQDYVAVRHVHDTLIHPTERQKMAAVWKKAVKFIEENESRIRTEVQQVWGEDATVWRWLGPTLNKTLSSQVNTDSRSESNHLYPDLSSLQAEAKKGSDRVWQGEAFETSEGSMNSLPSSPTQCLKIRHMFKHDKDYGPDWVLKVKDAIVEKCEGARIVHLSVDKESKEGCVYVKCATPQDAGIAFRQLHGSWFDGALVTVKYLRLERYHERFPDSAYARTPLRPSNNLRLSLQGTSSS